MKAKILTLAALFFFGQIVVNAQNPIFQKGEKVLNLGIGFGGSSPSGYKKAIPSASASFEVGVKGDGSGKGSLGIGGYVGYARYNEQGDYYENNYWTVNKILIGARGAFHYPLVNKLDTYGGVTLGIVARSWKWNGSGNPSHPSRKPVGGDLFVGGRYYFSDKLAAMCELSLATYLNLGVSMKF